MIVAYEVFLVIVMLAPGMMTKPVKEEHVEGYLIGRAFNSMKECEDHLVEMNMRQHQLFFITHEDQRRPAYYECLENAY